MTPVKHQLNLGACGVFAGVAVFEALIKKETDQTVDLSEQHIINCSTEWVPSGISSVTAMKFMKENGIVMEKYLPYQDKRTNKKPDHGYDFKLTDYHYVITDKMPLEDKVKTLKEKIYQYGPVATNMNFYKDLDSYEDGIYVYDGTSEEIGGHWIVIVGWMDDAAVKNGGYWICRNSWGNKWGEKGYFRIAYGESGVEDYWFVYGIYSP